MLHVLLHIIHTVAAECAVRCGRMRSELVRCGPMWSDAVISHTPILVLCSLTFSLMWSSVARCLLLFTAPGLMLPVSWYLCRILLTQPWETHNARLIAHGLTPWDAISTIFSRMWFGSGRPLINTPPSWFRRPWPSKTDSCHFQSP